MTVPHTDLGRLIEPAPVRRAANGEFPILSMTMRDGLVDQSAKFKKRVASTDTSAYRIVAQNQLVVGFPIDEGVLAFQDLYPEAIVSPAYGIWDIRSETPVDPQYFRTVPAIVSRSCVLRSKLRGTTARRRSLPRDVFLSLAIPLPSVAEQRRITDILDRTDALRIKRRAAVARIGALTQSIFVDFFGDPVSNPMKWPVSALGDILAFQQYGPRFYNEAYSDDGVRIVRITDLDESGGLDFAKMPKLAVSDAERTKYLLRPGDLLFARTGATVGKVAVIARDAPPCIAGAYFITMRFVPDVEPVFVRAALTSPAVRRMIAERSRQAAQQNFSGPALRALKIPVPPHAFQMRFADTLKAAEAVTRSQRASLDTLDRLCASIQNHAFQGDL